MQARLDFLTYLMSCCSTSGSLFRLEAQHLDIIWSCMVEGALTKRAADLVLDWLLKVGR